MATGGFTFGQTGASLGGGSTGLTGFGAPKSTTVAATGGFTLGGTAQQAAATTGGFNFGGAATAAKTTTSTGLSFGGLSTTTAASTGIPFGGFGGTATTSTASTGLTLGGLGGTTTTAPTGFTLGSLAGSTTPATTGFTLGALGGTTTPASTGFTLGGVGGTTTTAASGFSLGGLGGTTSSTAGLPFGGLSTATTTTSSGLGLGATTSTGSSIFSSVANPATIGLGGVDPKTSVNKSGTTTTNGKPGDAKAVKETPMPNPLVQTVEDFKKHIKDQKSVREDIARMSSKSMYKVQEDVVSLKQLLSVVSNGLQRNAAAIEKLKWEAAQELKNAEMAHRTKDIPAGLQYENTAPTEYFHHLVEDFEMRMQTYRQQIETMESHLASLHQPSKMSPHELVLLLRKLHETFVALAAQLHQVHEAVKTQKEHYLNYRKVFHADSKNVFERHKKPIAQPSPVRHTDLGGPNPFTGISSAAAVAMASALNRSQEPAAGAPPAVGLGTSTLGGQTSMLTGGLFGSTGTIGSGLGLGAQTSGFGFGGLGTAANTSTVKPLGTSLFGTPSASASTGFGLGATPQAIGIATPISGTTPGFGTPGGAPVENKTFFLSKPPVKRGKR